MTDIIRLLWNSRFHIWEPTEDMNGPYEAQMHGFNRAKFAHKWYKRG